MTEEIRDVLKQGLSQQLSIAAEESITLILNRIRFERVDENGVAFTSYSEYPLSKNKYDKYVKTGIAPASVRSAVEKAKGGLSYADFRRAWGKQVQGKDFTLTGDMFLNLKVLEVTETENEVEVAVGFDDPEQVQKYLENVQREGREIVGLSESEMDMVTDGIMDWLTQAIQ